MLYLNLNFKFTPNHNPVMSKADLESLYCVDEPSLFTIYKDTRNISKKNTYMCIHKEGENHVLFCKLGKEKNIIECIQCSPISELSVELTDDLTILKTELYSCDAPFPEQFVFFDFNNSASTHIVDSSYLINFHGIQDTITLPKIVKGEIDGIAIDSNNEKSYEQREIAKTAQRKIAALESEGKVRMFKILDDTICALYGKDRDRDKLIRRYTKIYTQIKQFLSLNTNNIYVETFDKAWDEPIDEINAELGSDIKCITHLHKNDSKSAPAAKPAPQPAKDTIPVKDANPLAPQAAKDCKQRIVKIEDNSQKVWELIRQRDVLIAEINALQSKLNEIENNISHLL